MITQKYDATGVSLQLEIGMLNLNLEHKNSQLRLLQSISSRFRAFLRAEELSLRTTNKVTNKAITCALHDIPESVYSNHERMISIRKIGLRQLEQVITQPNLPFKVDMSRAYENSTLICSKIPAGQVSWSTVRIQPEVDISLQGVERAFKLSNNLTFLNVHRIKSHVLGLILLDGKYIAIDAIDEPSLKWSNIVLRYKHNQQDMLACQDELIDAGFEELAQL